MKRKINVMLDSGAFSAYQRKESIDLSAYIDFIQEHKDVLESYVNLDVIPPTESAVSREEAAKASYRNWRQMVKAGLTPIPVFHFGERSYWLERMVKEGAERVGLGGVAKRKSSDKRQWITGAFNLLSHHPKTKVHGFGISSWKLLDAYPWDSADSTTWMQQGGLGEVFVPHNGKIISLNLSGSFDLNKQEIAWLETWAKTCGSSLELLKTKYWERSRLNVKATLAYERSRHVSRHKTGFFTGTGGEHRLKFYFSCAASDKCFFWVLETEKVTKVLITYYVKKQVMRSVKRSFRDICLLGLWTGHIPEGAK